MNQIATRPSTKVEQYVGEVIGSRTLDLPAHIKPAMFQRNLLNAVMINPDLMKFDPRLLFREVSKAAALGLFLDPQLGEAYLVSAYNYKTRATEPQLRVGYRGLIKLARQGDVRAIYAHEVCENDRFACRLGTEKVLEHEPEIFGERGEIVGYYAVMKLGNGETDFELMSLAQVHKIRDRTDSWKAFAESKIKSTPWASDEEEMAKKTVIRRLLKRAPQSPELAEAFHIETAADHGVSRIHDLTPPVPRPLGEVKRLASREQNQGFDLDEEFSPGGQESPTPPTPPKPPARRKTSEPDQEQPRQHDPEAFRKWFEGAVNGVQSAYELQELWETRVEALDHFPPDREDLLAIFRRREHELEE